jgi:hypothetical protein
MAGGSMRGRTAWLVGAALCLWSSLLGSVRSGAGGTLTVDDFAGTWVLREVDGQAPSTADIKALVLDIAADGKWTAHVETLRGRWLGRSLVVRGRWSLGDGVIRFTQSQPPTIDHATGWLEGGRLVVDPDLIVRSRGWTTPASCAYERTDGPRSRSLGAVDE